MPCRSGFNQGGKDMLNSVIKWILPSLSKTSFYYPNKT